MSHTDTIERNNDVLLRCTTINLFVIDFLRAKDVLDDAQESDLKAEKSQQKQRRLLFKWLKEGTSDRYESFLQVMKDAEQEHVANLLTGCSEVAHLPLSDARYTRLVKIRYKMAYVTQIDSEVIAELRSLHAISMTDAEEIRAETVDYAKVSKLISAIMRRSNYSFNNVQEVLGKTHQTAAAKYLEEGEMPAVHIKSNRPDLDGPLSLAFNGAIGNENQGDTEVKKLLANLNGLSLNPVRAVPGQSIVVFIYCKTVENAAKFTQLYNSGRLQNILHSILKRLLLTIEPQNTKILRSIINLEEEEILTLEEFTGIEGWMIKSMNKGQKTRIELHRCDAYTQTGWSRERDTEKKAEEMKLGIRARSFSVLEEKSKKGKLLDKQGDPTEVFGLDYAHTYYGKPTERQTFSLQKRKAYPSKPYISDDFDTDIDDYAHTYYGKPTERQIFSLQKRRAYPSKPYISDDFDTDNDAREDYMFHRPRRVEETPKYINKITNQLELGRQRERVWKQDDLFHLKRKLEETQKENVKLMELLEHHTQRGEFPERYKSDPILVRTIRIEVSERQDKSIKGMAILDKELFVVIEESSVVEVYDSVHFSFSRRWNLKELVRPINMGSCKKNKCLYIFDSKDLGEILRVDPNGKLLKNWPTVKSWFDCLLSVTKECTVILTVYGEHKLHEYSPDGLLIRETNLSSVAGIHHPTHAIQMSNGHFVISHGDGGLYTVSTVDADGKLQKSLSEESKLIIAEMYGPAYLSVDGNGFVMVADRFNNRVMLFDSDLEFQSEIIPRAKHGLRRLQRILLDESNGRLFVIDNESVNQRILIFQFM